MNKTGLDSEKTMKLIVSPVCTDKQGEKYACISFIDGDRVAEGRIPDCKITLNSGFSDEEVEGLCTYLAENLMELKKTAAQQSPFKAMMKK